MSGGFSRYRIVFVTGKGGVGKSLVSAALALAHAEQGKQVLLAELGSRSFFEKFFGVRYGQGPTALRPGLDVTRWDGDMCLREYLAHYLQFERAADVFLRNPVMGAVVGAAPALDELVMLGKITSGHRHHWHSLHYDVLVVDAYATGHFLALLRSPRGMFEVVSVGRAGRYFQGISEILHNPGICEYHIVTLPEELPVTETIELHGGIGAEVGVEARVICNKLLPPEHQSEVERLDRQSTAHQGSCLHYLSTSYRRQREALGRLAQIGADVRRIPYFFHDDPWRLVSEMAALVRG